MVKHLLYEELEGRLRDQEDWWYVVADDDTGSITVLHEWSRPGADKGAAAASGEYTYTMDEFLNSDGPQEVKAELETFLSGGGRA